MATAETSPSIQNEDLRTKMTLAQEPEPDPDGSEEKYSLGSMLFNVGLLSLCFGMGWAMFFAQVATTTVAAKQWASTAFGTVPYGILAITHAICAIPIQLLMRKYGPRRGYIVGGLLGGLGNFVHVFAAIHKSPILLLIGSPFLGIANAYANFLRFEPSRFVSPRRVPLAISAVVAGGVVGGGLGPMISRFTIHTLGCEYEGTYVLCSCIWLLFSCVVPWIHFPSPGRPERVGLVVQAGDEEQDMEAAAKGDEKTAAFSAESAAQHGANGANGATGASESRPERPLWEIVKHPQCYIAMLSSTLSYTVMATVMLNTVLAMKAVQPGSGRVDVSAPKGVFNFDDTSNAILVHVEAMFIPSLFTGFIIKNLGPSATVFSGLLLMVVGDLIFLSGTQFWMFTIALAVMGVGWNFGFVGSTAMLAQCRTNEEKDKVQGLNDGLTFGVNAIITATSSLVLQTMNDWTGFILVYTCLLVPALGASFFHLIHKILPRIRKR